MRKFETLQWEENEEFSLYFTESLDSGDQLLLQDK
jgi:hypothetical protein